MTAQGGSVSMRRGTMVCLAVLVALALVAGFTMGRPVYWAITGR
eukprot:CAMPEP_0182875528 /NCGR_PEP_ID=MMETSP0034_2-20130328/13595_1 /TAXON_ID=156128 /ORGANISM="Nephroselmis pyriformis, Strain CCMP717" /LENGTH=43 /DNA_ID= /DNA_START= /DNA_END= /DNA_ORIENTATION=